MKLSPGDKQGTAAAFRVMCGLFARLFDERPEDEFMARLADNRALFLEDPFSSLAAEPSAALHDVLKQAGMPGSDAFTAFVTEVQRDHTYLFRMVGVSRTSPYESVYRTDDHTLFGPTTLEVRACYRAYGMQATDQGSRPDDHIAHEFSFLEYLLGMQADGDSPAGDGTSATVERDIAAFLGDHVLVFAPLYLKNVQVRAQEPFYRAIAAIADAMLAAMADVYGARVSDRIDECAYLLEPDTI